VKNPVAAAMRVSRIGKRRRVRSPKENDYAARFKSEKAIKVARAWVAFTKGLFLPIGDTSGQRNLFVVTKFFKSRDQVAFKLEQVYKFDQPSTTTTAEPWLLPASEKVASQCQAIFNSLMKKLGK
jgi:hypothetical protein